MFKTSNERIKQLSAHRKFIKGKIIPFGFSFLDDCMRGLFPTDLLLVGAASGAGKTQFCSNLAKSAAKLGRRVHYFALEAEENEIEHRIMYQHICDQFYNSRPRIQLNAHLNFEDWELGLFDDKLGFYEESAQTMFDMNFSTLNTFYKKNDFTADSLMEYVSLIRDETDLIIVDHTHYFDWEDADDNRAIKTIAKAARSLSLEYRKPIVLVGHLRKRDKRYGSLCPDQEEFHGSSDLYKIATKIITMAPGMPVEGGGYYTYIRAAKSRKNGGVVRYAAELVYDETKGNYRDEYKLTWANAKEFEEIDGANNPWWVGRSTR